MHDDTVGDAGRRTGEGRNSNAVAMPKLAPAPRRPQKRSGFLVGARADLPTVRGDYARPPRRLSIVSPCFALQAAHPAAERQSPDAGVRDDADGADETVLPERRRRAARSSAPPPTRAVRACGVNRGHRAYVRDRSTMSVVARAEARAMLWPPPPHGDRQIAFAAAELDGHRDILRMLVGSHDQEPGRRSTMPFHTTARRVVAGIAWASTTSPAKLSVNRARSFTTSASLSVGSPRRTAEEREIHRRPVAAISFPAGTGQTHTEPVALRPPTEEER